MRSNDQIEQFLKTGDYDPNLSVRSGQNFVEAERAARNVLLDALIAEVRKHEGKITLPTPIEIGVQADQVRAKLDPVVRGLFPKAEQTIVLDMLSGAFVFLRPDNIEAVLRNSRWLSTAWNLACIYGAARRRCT